jgi:hypothetical protein
MAGRRTRTPFFVTGAHRSGTTLLRLLLGHHSRIARCLEFEYAVGWTGRHDVPDIAEYHSWLATDRQFQSTGYRIDPQLSYPELLKSFLEQTRSDASEILTGACVHGRFDRLLRVWPDALFVHIRRDPRDVAPSVVRMGWSGNVWAGVRRWIETDRLWSTMKESLDPTQYIELRFEDLVRDPERVLNEVCEFLGVSYEPEMLEIDKDTSYSPPGPNIASDWRTKLSRREIRLVETRVGDRLVDCGYEHSGLAPIRLNPVKRAWLRFQDRLGRIRFRLTRYGLRLYLEDVLSRRLPIASWKASVTLRTDEIIRRHLK